MRHLFLIAVLSLVSAAAFGEGIEPQHAPRVVHIPTADLQPAPGVWATVGASHRKGFGGALATGLGKLAEIELAFSDDIGTCSGCDEDEAAKSLLIASAALKIGVGEGALARWQPAMAIGLRSTFAGKSDSSAEYDKVRVARLFAAVSKQVGPLRLHLGADVWDARVTLDDARWEMNRENVGDRVRPFAGVVFTPPSFPKTQVLGDFSFTPVVADGRAENRWLGGWGVRYQVVSWSSIELMVRHREGDELADSTVLVRLNMHAGRRRP